MSKDRFDFFGIYDRVLGRGAQNVAGTRAWPSRLPFIRPLSLHETISRAGAYAIGIAGLCGVTYLFLYISETLHG
jgi:hypothetical protein